jgi:hypothetical protein
MHDVQNFSNRVKLERTVTLKKSNSMSTQSEDLFERTAQITGPYHPSVQSNRTIRRDLHDKVFWMVDGNRSARWLRQARRQSHLLVRDDHEDDQKHQQNVDQRNHILSDTIPRLTAQKEPTSHLASRNTPAEEDSHNPRNRKKTYWPASSLAVIRPTRSMPACFIKSMALATSMN